MNKLFGKNFINTQDWQKKDLELALKFAFSLKKKFHQGKQTPFLPYQTLFLLFFFSSTRTRASFEAAMDHLGGISHDLNPEKMQITHGDTPKEIGKILSSYGHAIAIRHCDYQTGNKYIMNVAKHASVPIYNMQCDYYHPFQAMADLMTIIETKKTVKKKKIVLSWAYAKSYSKPLSVPQSALLLLTQFGADVTLCHPPEFKLMPEILKIARGNARKNQSTITTTHSMSEAFKDADIVYPKSWGPLVHTTDPTQGAKIINQYKDWICDEKIMSLTKKDSIYMHCLPADRGVEVSDEIIDGKHSVVYQQAENRLHVQKAIMLLTMAKKLPKIR